MTTITLAKSAGPMASARVLRSLTEETAPAPATLDWTELDPSTLNGALRKHYEAYVELRNQTKAAKANFETAMNAAASPGQGLKLVFGYNFGKLSVAVAPASPAPRRTRAAMSFDDFAARR